MKGQNPRNRKVVAVELVNYIALRTFGTKASLQLLYNPAQLTLQVNHYSVRSWELWGREPRKRKLSKLIVNTGHCYTFNLLILESLYLFTPTCPVTSEFTSGKDMRKGEDKNGKKEASLVLRKQRNFISVDIITLHYATQSQLNEIIILSLLYPLNFTWSWKLKYMPLHSLIRDVIY